MATPLQAFEDDKGVLYRTEEQANAAIARRAREVFVAAELDSYREMWGYHLDRQRAGPIGPTYVRKFLADMLADGYMIKEVL